MKKLIYISTIFVGLISACNSSDNKTNSNSTSQNYNEVSSEGQTNLELEYLKIRNDYVRHFNNISENNSDLTKADKQDNDALLILEKMLKELLKSSSIDSVVKYGKINLETLQPDLGFGMLDGLILNKYSPDQLQTFVTSKKLFIDYFKSQKINSIKNLTSRQLGNIFSSLISDARATVFYSENISSSKNNQVYGSIGTIAQDIAPFPPDNIFVLVENGNYIYIFQKNFDRPIKEIIECKATYDSIYFNSQKYFDTYKRSNLKDTTAINKTFELEENAWNKYCDCYQEKFKRDKQYMDVQKQIEKIVEYAKQKNSL